MKSLYLLMTRYIRQQDDIERAGQGVYSPGLRDDAQDARNALIAFIRETPGKAAFLALLEMARAHPDEEFDPGWDTTRRRGRLRTPTWTHGRRLKSRSSAGPS